MKSMKKLLAIALVLVMLAGLGITAMAADSASIEITHDKTYEENVDPDNSTARVYLAYKIFDASYDTLAGENDKDDVDDFTYDPDDAAVSYTMAEDSPWVDAMKADGQTWFNVSGPANGVYVITPAGEDGASYSTVDHAKAFAKYLADNIPADAESTEVEVDGAAVDVDPGYYLIIAKDDKDKSTALALVTTDVTMVEKNGYMGTHKETAQTNYYVGQPITYTATVDIPGNAALTIEDNGSYKDGHGPIIIYDIMDARLTFDPDSVT